LAEKLERAKTGLKGQQVSTSVEQVIDPVHVSVGMFDQGISQKVWTDKYRYQGEKHPFDSMKRAIKGVYKDDPNDDGDEALQLMQAGIWMPAGRIQAGAGTDNRVTLINCFVCRTIKDSMEYIGSALKDAMLTQQMGGGIGMNFSTLRPNGAILRRTGAVASGPLPFMEMWNSMCATIMSAGSRRGAMMATMTDSHPDLPLFIGAKKEAGKLTNFNMSILVSDAFMDAIANDAQWPLYFNVPPEDRSHIGSFIDDQGVEQFIYRVWEARELWELITKTTYEYSEPGVIFIDRVNDMNNLQYIEDIRCTNPCAEQPLPPNGACNLGAINVGKLVKDPFRAGASFSWEILQSAARVGVRFLDNVASITQYPLKAQQREQHNKRRIGLGISGLADAMAQLGLVYGSSESCTFAEKVMEAIAEEAYCTSAMLAKERGVFPLYNAEKILGAPFVKKLSSGTQDLIKEHGLRNGVLLTIAPTGTTTIYYGNGSSGLEPTFEHVVDRKIRQADGSYTAHPTQSYIYRLYNHVHGNNIPVNMLPPYMVVASDLKVADHVVVQAACQKWVDASVSKTINCPEEISFEEFRGVYTLAYEMGCKGCTTYRPSPIRDSVFGDTVKRKKLVKSVLPRRNEVLSGKTYKVSWPGAPSSIYVTINSDENGDPFEMFFNSKSLKNNEWMTALSLMISAMMRAGYDISFIPDELAQVVSAHDSAWIEGKHYGSLVAYLGGILSLHLGQEEETVKTEELSTTGEACSRCGAYTVIHQEGCATCMSCGHSNC